MRNLYAIEFAGQHVQAILDEFNERRLEWVNFDAEDIASISVRDANDNYRNEHPHAHVIVTIFYWRDVG